MRVIWCDTLGNSYFQTNVIDNIETFYDYYLHITVSILCTHTNCCTHYTQIFAKWSIWDYVCCLIWPSLIAYDFMCKWKYLFWLGIWRVFFFFFWIRILKSVFLTSWLVLIFAFKRYHVFKNFSGSCACVLSLKNYS